MSAVQSTGRRAAARAIQLLAVALAATLLAPSLTTAQPILPGAVVALGRQSAVAVSHQVVVTWSAATVGATRAQRLATLGQPALTDRVSGAAGAQASYVRPFGLAGTSAVYRFAEPLGQGAGLTIDRIARMAGVVKVEPDPWMTIDTLPSDGNAGYVWGALGPSDTSVYGVATYGINAVASWATTTGSGVKVGVIDTGWVNHTDLAGQSLTGYDFISDTTQANDGDGRDADPSDAGDWVTAGEATASCTAHNSTWHGMHVSGTIAAIANNGYGTFGAAPNAKIVPIRALGKCGGSMSDIADALTWAYGGTVAGVPANANPVKVVNMSLGGTTSCPSYMQTAVTNARAAGTVVVVAAGNSGVDAGLSAPANCTGSLVVAATDIAGIRSVWSATGSSNYGSIVDIAAPGSSIASTWNSGTTTPVASPGGDTLGVMGGTSMATPHVAALAALLFEDYGTAQPAAIEYAITHGVTAFAADASAGHCTTSTCGAGIANAPAALAALVAADRTAPTATLTPPSSPTSATTLTYTAGFSESVTGLTAADLSVTGAGCVVGTPTGSGASWTVPVTGCAEGSVVLTLAASSVADSPVGNVGPASPVTATTVTVDRTAPVSAASIVAGYTTTTSVTVGYTVSDASVVSSITAWYSTAANLGSPSACGAIGLPGASGNIACTIPAVDGTYYIYTIASDLAGNVEPAPVTPDDSIVRDATSPSVTVSGPATPTSAATLTFGLTFSESVSGLISADLTKGGAASGCIIGTPTGSGTTWSVDLTTCGEGTVSLVVNANSVVDVHGLTGPVSPSSSGTITVDRTAPASSGSITATTTTGTSISVSFSASDASSALTGVVAYSSTSAALTSPTQCGAVSGASTSGVITCTIPAVDATYYVYTRATDAAGNTEAAPGAADDSIVRDATAPTALLSPVAAVTSGNPAYTLTLSENVADLAAPDFTRGGTATGCVVSPAGSGTSRTITLTGCTEGTTTLTLDAGSITDAAGNGGPAVAVPGGTVTIDRTSPSVPTFALRTASDTGRLTDDLLTSATSLVFDLVFAESVTGLTAADLVPGGTATGCVVTPGGSGTTYTITLTGCTEGTVTLALNANAAADAAGNTGPAPSSITLPAITIDRTGPSLGIVANQSSPTTTSELSFGLGASEALDCGTISTAAGVDLTTTGVASFGAVTGAGTTLCTIPATASAGDGQEGTVTLGLGSAFSVADDAGNTTTSVSGLPIEVRVDRKAPAITAASATAALTKVQPSYTITFSEPVSDLTAEDLAIDPAGTATGCLAGAPVEVAASSMTSFTIDLTGCSDGTVRLALAASSAVDVAGHRAPASPYAFPTVTVDMTTPAVSPPAVTPRAGLRLTGTAVPVTVAWTGSDTGGSGIAGYVLSRSTDGGSTWTAVTTTVAISCATTVPSTGSTRFKVVATDKAGNQTEATGIATVALVQQASGVVYAKTWSVQALAGFSGGSVKWSKVASATASYTFTGRGIAFVTTRAATRGKVRIYVDNVLQGTYDLKATATGYRTLAWQKSWATSAKHTVRIVVLATAGRPRVDLDAFVVVK